MSSSSDEGGHGQIAGDTLPRPRIQTLSDLIFGLALSIGAIALLSAKPSDLLGLIESLVGFGWAFLMLALIWVRYTKVMSVLPVETGGLIAANMLLLFLVSVEPYLYSLIGASFAPAPGQLDPGTTTAIYAIDMGSIFVMLAYFTNELTIEEKRLIPKDLLRSFRLLRNGTLVSAGLFYISIVPAFWAVEAFGIQIRFILWMGVFLTWIVRRMLERRMKHPPAQ